MEVSCKATVFCPPNVRSANHIGVIPNHFNKSFYMTLSELDETWCASSTCGFMKPDEVPLLSVVWLLGKGPLNIPVFSNFCRTGYYLNPCNFHISYLLAK